MLEDDLDLDWSIEGWLGRVICCAIDCVGAPETRQVFFVRARSTCEGTIDIRTEHVHSQEGGDVVVPRPDTPFARRELQILNNKRTRVGKYLEKNLTTGLQLKEQRLLSEQPGNYGVGNWIACLRRFRSESEE